MREVAHLGERERERRPRTATRPRHLDRLEHALAVEEPCARVVVREVLEVLEERDVRERDADVLGEHVDERAMLGVHSVSGAEEDRRLDELDVSLTIVRRDVDDRVRGCEDVRPELHARENGLGHAADRNRRERCREVRGVHSRRADNRESVRGWLGVAWIRTPVRANDAVTGHVEQRAELDEHSLRKADDALTANQVARGPDDEV